MRTIHALQMSLSILSISGFNSETVLLDKDRALSCLTSHVCGFQSWPNVYSSVYSRAIVFLKYIDV